MAAGVPPAHKKEKEELKKIFDSILREYGIDVKDVTNRFNEINALIHEIRQTMVTKESFSLEMKTLTTRIEAVDKRVDDWRDSTKTYFTVLGIIVAVAGILVPIFIRFL